MDLAKIIEEKRPNLTKSSVTTYVSILKNLFKKNVDKDTEMNMEWFQNEDKILDILKDKPSKNRKTTLSALVVLVGKEKSEKYLKQMLEDKAIYDKSLDNQKKSDKQEKNWITLDEIQTIFNELNDEAKHLMKKDIFKMEELQKIQNLVIVGLMSGLFIVPRRLVDYACMKIKNVDLKENYYDPKKHELVFNVYKTAKTYKEQQIKIESKILINLLKNWIEINPTDYLLFDMNKNCLTPVKLNQRLISIFKKNIGSSLLRSVYFTDLYKGMPALSELKKIEEQAGNSIGVQLASYVKKD
jgi:hypothetical protein